MQPMGRDDSLKMEGISSLRMPEVRPMPIILSPLRRCHRREFAVVMPVPIRSIPNAYSAIQPDGPVRSSIR